MAVTIPAPSRRIQRIAVVALGVNVALAASFVWQFAFGGSYILTQWFGGDWSVPWVLSIIFAVGTLIFDIAVAVAVRGWLNRVFALVGIPVALFVLTSLGVIPMPYFF